MSHKFKAGDLVRPNGNFSWENNFQIQTEDGEIHNSGPFVVLKIDSRGVYIGTYPGKKVLTGTEWGEGSHQWASGIFDKVSDFEAAAIKAIYE